MTTFIYQWDLKTNFPSCCNPFIFYIYTKFPRFDWSIPSSTLCLFGVFILHGYIHCGNFNLFLVTVLLTTTGKFQSLPPYQHKPLFNKWQGCAGMHWVYQPYELHDSIANASINGIGYSTSRKIFDQDALKVFFLFVFFFHTILIYCGGRMVI